MPDAAGDYAGVMLFDRRHQQGMTTTTLSVANMTCMKCVTRVDHALSGLAGVEAVDVDLRAGLARIRHAANLPIAALSERLAAAGYPARLAS